MDQELEQRLKRLLDKQDIEELILKYGRGIDRRDADLIRSVLHPDAVFEHFDLPNGRLAGADEIADQTLILASWINAGSHFLPQTLIEFDGEVAFAETYALTCIVTEDELGKKHTYSRGIRLFHRLERRDGVNWKISYRTGRHDGYESRAELPQSRYESDQSQIFGTHKPRDISYYLAQALRDSGKPHEL